MEKLTKLECMGLLRSIGDRPGRHWNAGYPPIAWLLENGFIECKINRVLDTFYITDAGRDVLAARAARAKE